MTESQDAIAERLEAAAALMREAGALARDYFARRDELAVEFKGTQDLVSAADREVEKLVRARLAALFPGDGVIGEEEGRKGDTASVWIVDPIDGTQNFLRGLPYWTVVLAYVRDGVCELGLTYDPVHDELFTARRGHGAWSATASASWGSPTTRFTTSSSPPGAVTAPDATGGRSTAARRHRPRRPASP
jgi:myo-inositol-1(or 4)-monophosphatase